jgi:hypothetical protein
MGFNTGNILCAIHVICTAVQVLNGYSKDLHEVSGKLFWTWNSVKHWCTLDWSPLQIMPVLLCDHVLRNCAWEQKRHHQVATLGWCRCFQQWMELLKIILRRLLRQKPQVCRNLSGNFLLRCNRFVWAVTVVSWTAVFLNPITRDSQRISILNQIICEKRQTFAQNISTRK